MTHEPDRYEQLAPWPEHRPSAVNTIVDYRTKTVFITGRYGEKLLAFPFDAIRQIADDLEPKA